MSVCGCMDLWELHIQKFLILPAPNLSSRFTQISKCNLKADIVLDLSITLRKFRYAEPRDGNQEIVQIQTAPAQVSLRAENVMND